MTLTSCVFMKIESQAFGKGFFFLLILFCRFLLTSYLVICSCICGRQQCKSEAF